MDMVRDSGFKMWHEWKFVGQEITGLRTGRFKLVTT